MSLITAPLLSAHVARLDLPDESQLLVRQVGLGGYLFFIHVPQGQAFGRVIWHGNMLAHIGDQHLKRLLSQDWQVGYFWREGGLIPHPLPNAATVHLLSPLPEFLVKSWIVYG